MNDLIYIDECGLRHNVRIHNFDKNDNSNVRVIGSCKLNPSDKTYPDKKWVKVSQLFELTQATFTDRFIKENSL